MSTFRHAAAKCGKLINFLNYQRTQVRCLRCMAAVQYTTSPYSLSWGLHRQSIPSRVQQRCYSGQRNFIQEFIDNVRKDMAKNKDMKENLKKFREEAEKLEQSDALQKAREKYSAIESETSKGSEILKEKMSVLQEKMKETMSDAEKTELAQKYKQVFEDIGKTIEKTAETVGKSKDDIAKSQVFKSVSQSVRAVQSELDQAGAKMYRPPKTLRKRLDQKSESEKKVEADTEATDVVMHKDSRFYQTWQSFKENNPLVTKMFDIKMKYDESDHVVVRATRAVTDKFTDLFGGLFTRTEMSEVLTEIVKMDPNFDKEKFILDCRKELIPNILEALVRGDLEILEDWCYEAAFNVLATPIKQAQAAGYKIEARVLDINNVDIVAGKMMEQGPVLVITFIAQQIMCVRDANGSVKEGDADKIMKIMYIWAFCRDQSVLDPRAAWRLIDLSSQSMSEQWL